MARKPGFRQSPLRARLRPESLEERSLLAPLAAFSLQLYRDAGGAPGELIADDTVAVGESFFVEITAHDLRAQPTGLAGVALDLGWNSAVLSVIDAPFVAGDVITPKLPALRGGTLDAAAGTIDNLRAAADSARAVVGRDSPERFALLHFQALAPAVDAPLRMRQGVSQIAFRAPVWTTWRDFEFERQTITVIDASSAPAAAANVPPAQQPVAPDSHAPVYVEWTVDAAAAPQTISREALARLAGQDFDPPHVFLTRVQVEVASQLFDLPLVVSPVEGELPLPAGTRRIGLVYTRESREAVFGAVPVKEVFSGVELDDELIQALASGLAAADSDEPRDPFTIHFEQAFRRRPFGE